MLLRYSFELIVGLLVVIMILLLGEIGNIFFVLFAFLPLLVKIKKRKVDERELYVFYQAGNLTMGLTVISLYFIHRFFDTVINGHAIGENWFPLSIGAILVVHGMSGLIMSRK